MEYYDRIFGDRSPAYDELIQALADELEDYAASLGPTLKTGDPEVLARLRHSHLPLVENLKLSGLQAWEAEVKNALEAGMSRSKLADLESRFVQEARTLASALISVRFQAGPKPR